MPVRLEQTQLRAAKISLRAGFFEVTRGARIGQALSLRLGTEVLVGRVEDEYDVTAKLIERRENGLWEVDGRLTLEELEETLGVSLGESEKEGVTTAAGLALKAFGKIPAEGDATTFNKLSLKVTRMRDQRVRRLELRCIEECPAETEGRIEVSDHPLSDESAIMPLPRPQPPTSGSQP